MRWPALVVAVSCVFSTASSQVRPTPESRRDLTPPLAKSEPSLPSIDLPEFVITGLASIDLPKVEKKMELGSPAGDVHVGPSPIQRERPIGSAPGSGLESNILMPVEKFSGNARLGFGSFRMPTFAAGIVQPLGDAVLGASAHYARSTGFAPWTSWSEGGFAASIGLPVDLTPVGPSRAALSGRFGLDSRTFHWYGRRQPSAGREISSLFGGAGLSGAVGAGWRGALDVDLRSTNVIDTTSTVNEGSSRVQLAADGRVADLPFTAGVELLASGRSNSAGSAISATVFHATGRWDPMEGVAITAGVRLGLLKGELGQNETRLFPLIRLQFVINEQHRLVGAYEPSPSPITLVSSIDAHRFLSSRSTLRHAVWTNAGRFGIESDWTQDLRTRFEVEAGTADDLAMVADTAGAGSWNLMYGGASTTAFRAECIAKMRGNDYFSATVIMRASTNAASGLHIPYLPSFEGRLSYVAVMAPALTLRASLQIVHEREAAWAGPSVTLPGYSVVDLHGSYALTSNVTLWTSVTNLMNVVYEHWKGYQEPPFRLSAGAAVAW